LNPFNDKIFFGEVIFSPINLIYNGTSVEASGLSSVYIVTMYF